MKKATLLCAIWMTGAAATIVLPVSAAPHTPKVGSSERTSIMNALHPVLGSGRHKPLVIARRVKVDRGWVFVEGDFKYADGAPLEEDYTEGSGTNFSALLHREGGKWKVKRRLYHGDVVIPEFMHDFPKAPRSIFQ
ncbi:hypothetical protein IAD21_03126 [Abditibacteriota bacterium]|nr:hypothetical protein IAD21_03126 [Abditibacteriota bacterium]